MKINIPDDEVKKEIYDAVKNTLHSDRYFYWVENGLTEYIGECVKKEVREFLEENKLLIANSIAKYVIE